MTSARATAALCFGMLAIACFSFAWTTDSGESAKATMLAPMPILTVPFEGTTVDTSRTWQHATPSRGIARPRSLSIITTEVEGPLATVDVREGQFVRRGERLGLINDAATKKMVAVAATRASSVGSIKQAESELERARLTLERTQSTHQRSSTTQHELDLAQIAVERAEADLLAAQESQQVAQAQYDYEQAVLDSHAVVAPFDGVILKVEAAAGETLTTTTPFVTIATLDVLRAELHVSLDVFGTLAVGDELTLTAGAPVRAPVDARVVFIDPVVDAASRTFRCVFEISNADGALPAGFTVELDADDAIAMGSGSAL